MKKRTLHCWILRVIDCYLPACHFCHIIHQTTGTRHEWKRFMHKHELHFAIIYFLTSQKMNSILKKHEWSRNILWSRINYTFWTRSFWRRSSTFSGKISSLSRSTFSNEKHFDDMHIIISLICCSNNFENWIKIVFSVKMSFITILTKMTKTIFTNFYSKIFC